MVAAGASLKDQLFNAESLGDLGREYSAALPGLDAAQFAEKALSGVADRSLMACLDWFADCLEPELSSEFPVMAEQLEAAMPPRLDPSRSDDDFGRFIHAVPGVLAVRHGLVSHPERALDLLYEATQRFSMEFYIRPFLNDLPELTLARLRDWSKDANYHVRRLVSEGTRPKLPWAKAVTLGTDQTLPLLDVLHADPTRFVTRSVANHLNDIAKTEPDLVIERLTAWRSAGKQSAKELGWMTRHALRTLVKQGYPGALGLLGYEAEAEVEVRLKLDASKVRIGDVLEFDVDVSARVETPVIVDYRIEFHRPGGLRGEKVFKMKTSKVGPNAPLALRGRRPLKADATTFRLYPGPHVLFLQVNGVDRASAEFTLV